MPKTQRAPVPQKTNCIKSVVESMHSEHLQQIGALKKKISDTRKAIKCIPKGQRWRIQEKKTLMRKLQDAKKKLVDIQTAHQQRLRTAVELAEARSDKTQEEPHQTNAQTVAHAHPPPNTGECMRAYTMCSSCGQLLEKMVGATVMICPKCAVGEQYLDSSRTGLAFDEDIEFLNNTYKRSNHMQENLNQVQGRETGPIPLKIVHKIKQELYRMGLRETTELNPRVLRLAMKRLKLSDYYKNTTSIISQLTGRKPKRLLSTEELEFMRMFEVAQNLFEKYRPEGRRNMLSYSYTGYKICEMKGFYWMLPYFKLLKGDDKLYKQDEVWKKICKHTGWPFIPSI